MTIYTVSWTVSPLGSDSSPSFQAVSDSGLFSWQAVSTASMAGITVFYAPTGGTLDGGYCAGSRSPVILYTDGHQALTPAGQPIHGFCSDRTHSVLSASGGSGDGSGDGSGGGSGDGSAACNCTVEIANVQSQVTANATKNTQQDNMISLLLPRIEALENGTVYLTDRGKLEAEITAIGIEVDITQALKDAFGVT